MIYIVTDTNYLNCSFQSGTDFTRFQFNKNFNDLLNLKNSGNCADKCEVCLSEMVYQELIQHKKEAYNARLQGLEEISGQMGELMSYKIGASIEEYSLMNQKMADCYIEEHHVLKIPFCREYFDDIIWDAIHKMPPFEGIKGKSDKGFKDVVIWYSMMEYAKEHQGTYLFVSADHIFLDNKKMLSEKFMQETGCRIEFCKNFLEVQQKTLRPQSRKVESVRITSAVKEWEFWTNQNKDLTVSWNYPYIEDKEIEAVRYINNDIRDIYETVLREWKSWHYENVNSVEKDWMREEHSDELEYEVLLNEGGILCIRFSQYIYSGGTHGMPVWKVRVYDLNTGKLLKLRDVVSGTDEEIYKIIERKFQLEKEIHSDFEHRPFYYPDFTLDDYQDIDDFKFYVSPAGVHIYFDVYEAGPYSEGFISFVICKRICRVG